MIETATCQTCGDEIPAARLAAMPGATLCAACLEAEGDVPMIQGYMSWEHKTAPTLILGRDAELLRPYDRSGFHADLPLNSKNNPRMIASLNAQNLSVAIRPALPPEDVNIEPAARLKARCHPDRDRVTPTGDCLECAQLWYERRKR